MVCHHYNYFIMHIIHFLISRYVSVGMILTGVYWCDISGHGNHFVAQSSLISTSTFNGYGILSTTAISKVQGAMSTVAFNNIRGGSSPYTVIAAYKPNTLSSSLNVLVSVGNANDQTCGSASGPIEINSYQYYGGGAMCSLGTASVQTGASVNTTKYVIQATTYDGNVESVYINGVLEKSAPMITSMPSNANNKVHIGFPFRSNSNMDANIGFILMYNRSLSGTEIMNVFNTYANRFSLQKIRSKSHLLHSLCRVQICI
jgi:hypothetical protein